MIFGDFESNLKDVEKPNRDNVMYPKLIDITNIMFVVILTKFAFIKKALVIL